MGAPPGFAALLQSPQGRAMMQQLMQNPAALQQMVPELANNPEAMALLRDPAALQQIMAMLQQSARPIPPAQNFVSREIFDVAIGCMNGAPLPAGTPPMAADLVRQEQAEIISRAQIDAALDEAVGPVPEGSFRASDFPHGRGIEDGINTEEGPDANSTGAEMDVLEAAEDKATEAVPSATADDMARPEAMESEAASYPYADALVQLMAMGFSDEAQCKSALDLAGGDVMTAVAFLTG